MPTIATVTLDGSRLTEHSTLTVDGVTSPVPARTEKGGVLAPLRIMAALTAAGYRPASGGYYQNLYTAHDNQIKILVVPIDTTPEA